jgi:hypothetical protein
VSRTYYSLLVLSPNLQFLWVFEIPKIVSSLILIFFFSKNTTCSSSVLTFSRTETRENQMPRKHTLKHFNQRNIDKNW